MPIAANFHHADRVFDVAMHGDGHSVGKDMITRSWRRCLSEYGLDPAANRGARVLTANELSDFRGPIEDFLHVAKSGLLQLYERVKALGYVVLLTDRHGVTVDFLGDDSMTKELRAASLYLGADWNESHAGTCGVGVALMEMQPLTCHRTDHFDVANTSLTCTAAPLLDPEGNPLAILDVSALRSPQEKESQYLLLQLVIMQARMIENANFVRYFHNNWIVRFGTVREFIEVHADNLLAVDETGKVIGANQSARQFLNSRLRKNSLVTGAGVIGNSLDEIFDCSMKVIVRPHSVEGQVSTVRLRSTGEELFATVRSPQRSTISSTGTEATVLTGETRDLSEYPELNRLSNNDPMMRRTLKLATRLVNRRVNILICGETGTGKELLARALHNSSDRSDQPFVAVNCAAIPESLIESELFGYRPGSFTGARSRGMRGLIEQSSGGTLFLDEIGDMPLHLQCRLLRVLSEREVTPIGADKAIPVDLNVIAATHRNLNALVESGAFRQDLYYRINGASLVLPSLREREDKEYIIDCLISAEAAATGHTHESVQISAEAMRILLEHPWPGNIRELRNALRYAVAMSDGRCVRLQDLPDELVEGGHNPTQTATEEFSPRQAQRYIPPENLPSDILDLIDDLRAYKWNITAVANKLGVCRATIYRRMKRHGIVPPNAL